MEIDVVLVSDAKNTYLKNLTEQAIATCGRHNIIVIESNKNLKYKNALTIHPTVKFNYNHYLNIGAKLGGGKYIFFGNNDLVFSNTWDIELVTAMKNNSIQSASPICPEFHPKLGIDISNKIIKGYKCREHFCGWAFMWERKLYEEIGELDEDFTFWCSDDSTIELLKKHNKDHFLVTSSIVWHIGKGRNTLKSLDQNTIQKYTFEELERFKIKFNKEIILPKFF